MMKDCAGNMELLKTNCDVQFTGNTVLKLFVNFLLPLFMNFLRLSFRYNHRMHRLSQYNIVVEDDNQPMIVGFKINKERTTAVQASDCKPKQPGGPAVHVPRTEAVPGDGSYRRLLSMRRRSTSTTCSSECKSNNR